MKDGEYIYVNASITEIIQISNFFAKSVVIVWLATCVPSYFFHI